MRNLSRLAIAPLAIWLLLPGHVKAVEIPRPVINIPKPVINVPRPVINVPRPVINVPKPVVNVPRPVVNVPRPMVTVPKVTVPKPTIAVTVPKVTAPKIDVPKSNIAVTAPKADVPHRTVDVPKLDVPKPTTAATVPTANISNRTVHTPPLDNAKPTVAVTAPLPTGTGSGATAPPANPNLRPNADPPKISNGGSKNVGEAVVETPVRNPNLRPNADPPKISNGGSKNVGEIINAPSQSVSKDQPVSAQVSLPNGTFGKVTQNPNGTVTLSNNFGSVTLTPQQMSKVASGDMSALKPLMGSAPSGAPVANGMGSQTVSNQVNLPNGTFGKAVMNSDGTVTVSNNFGSVRLTKQQMSQVAAGDMSSVAVLMGGSSSGKPPGSPGTTQNQPVLAKASSGAIPAPPGGCTKQTCVPGQLYEITCMSCASGKEVMQWGMSGEPANQVSGFVPPGSKILLGGATMNGSTPGDGSLSAAATGGPSQTGPAGGAQGQGASGSNGTAQSSAMGVHPPGIQNGSSFTQSGTTNSFSYKNGQWYLSSGGTTVPIAFSPNPDGSYNMTILSGGIGVSAANGGQTQTFLIPANYNMGTPASTSIPQAAPSPGNWNGPCEYCPGGRFMPNVTVTRPPLPALPDPSATAHFPNSPAADDPQPTAQAKNAPGADDPPPTAQAKNAPGTDDLPPSAQANNSNKNESQQSEENGAKTDDQQTANNNTSDDPQTTDNSANAGAQQMADNKSDDQPAGKPFTPGSTDDPNCVAGCYDPKVLNDVGIQPQFADGTPASPPVQPNGAPLSDVPQSPFQGNSAVPGDPLPLPPEPGSNLFGTAKEMAGSLKDNASDAMSGLIQKGETFVSDNKADGLTAYSEGRNAQAAVNDPSGFVEKKGQEKLTDITMNKLAGPQPTDPQDAKYYGQDKGMLGKEYDNFKENFKDKWSQFRNLPSQMKQRGNDIKNAFTDKLNDWSEAFGNFKGQ